MYDIDQSLRAKYLERRRSEIHKISSTPPPSCFEMAMQVGHQVKGNCATFGYEALTPLAVELEAVSKAHNEAQLQQVLHKMSDLLGQYE